MRKLLWGVALLLGLIGLGWVTLWLSLANQFENRLEAWANERRAEGWLIAHGGIRLGGFPLRLSAHVTAPDLAGGLQAGGHHRWSWQADSVAVEIDLLHRDTLLLSPTGQHRVSVQEGARRLAVLGQAARLDVVLRQGEQGDHQIEVKGRDVRLIQPGPPAALPLGSAESLEAQLVLHAERAPEPEKLLQPAFIELALTAEGVRRAGRGEAARADLDIALMGHIGTGALEEALTAWRDDGGTLELRQVTVQGPIIDIRLRGTVALDNQMRPLAALSGDIAGYNEILDHLTAGHWVSDRDAHLARLLFAAMAEQNPVTGRTMINLPLSVQNGIAMAGPLRLARLEPLHFAE